MPSKNNAEAPEPKIQELQQRIMDLEKALSESETRFHALTDSAPVGIMMDDEQGKAIYVNNKCAELVGIPAEESLNFDWIPFLHPDDRERMVSNWKQAFENSSEFHLQYRWVHSDGKVVWTLGDVVPVLGEDGKATLFIGTLTDITAQKEAEIEKEKLQAQLAQAQKMEAVGRLAGGVAHDYNNMLNVIMGNAELGMCGADESDSVYEHLQEIFKAAKRSAEITRQLLAFARKQTLAPKVFSMNNAVKDMLKMLKHLIGEDINLDITLESGGMPIKMDASQFDQIVVNLCINARDAIDGVGSITIKTATVVVDEKYCAEQIEGLPGTFARLSVSDNGSGMDRATLENVFEPFFTTKKVSLGTGLGLASVYGTVKQNNGFIDVHSEAGVGSTFDIYLPLFTDPIVEDEPTVSVSTQCVSGLSVLVVEDELSNLETIGRILSKAGFNVLTAIAPSIALDLARDSNEDIALLVTDVIMPEMSGLELVDRLRSSRPNMKCLYISGYPADIIGNQGVLGKNVNFIQKPFQIKELITKINETLAGEL